MSSGNISRVSTSLQTFTMLAQLRANSTRLFNEQQRLASGQRLLSGSDDPIAAEKIDRIGFSLSAQDQIATNLQHASDYLSAADSTVSNVTDILNQAARIASEQAGSTQSTDERSAQAVVVDSLIDQLRNLGNQQFQGLYMFGGRQVNQPPLNSNLGRVTYAGDTGDRSTLVDQGHSEDYDISAADILGLRDTLSGGYVNFDIQLSTDTRVTELGGATNNSVHLGKIQVTQTGPGASFQVDFTGAETVGDVINRFNAAATAAGSALTLGINGANGDALAISPAAGTIQVSEVGNGTTASDLGIKKSVAATALVGDSVNRRASLTTRLSDLQLGGISLPNGITIKNGTQSVNVDFTGAVTLQDVLNKINGSGVGVKASIRTDGRGLQIENLVAGTPLVVGENGGTDADALGIKTIDSSVLLSRLNGGRGIHPVSSGADFRVTNASGVSFDVSLGSAKTVGDVIAAINAAAAAAGAGVTARTSDGGAGIHLSGPAGAGQLSVQDLNLSPVAKELGIDKTGSATDLEGDDVAAFRQSGVFTALYRLRDALVSDNSSEITEAGSDINDLQKHVSGIAGQIGARSKSMQDRLQQTQDAVSATNVLLSNLKDVDYTEAVTKFQQAQTALQASLVSISKLQNLSLLNFLQ